MRMYAETDDEAIKRFSSHAAIDPFPDIESALLNSKLQFRCITTTNDYVFTGRDCLNLQSTRRINSCRYRT
jgi:hypothetical protein